MTALTKREIVDLQLMMVGLRLECATEPFREEVAKAERAVRALASQNPALQRHAWRGLPPTLPDIDVARSSASSQQDQGPDQ